MSYPIIQPGAGVSTLNELEDVDVSSPSDGEVLTYDIASGDWIASPSSGSVDNWMNANDGNDFSFTPIASGVNSIGIGNQSQATLTSSIAIGTSAQSTKIEGIAIGKGAQSTSDTGVAIGQSAVGESGTSILLRTENGALRVQADGTLETSSDGGITWISVNACNTPCIYYQGEDPDIAAVMKVGDFWAEPNECP